MPVYGNLAELGGVEGSVTSDSIMGYQENDVTNFLVADGTIQSAVDNANPGDVINLLEKIYRENVHIEKSLSLIGAGAEKTIVDGDTDGNGVGNGRVFYIGPDIDVWLAHMTIRNGNAYNDPFESGNGGGILSFGNVAVENCDIHDNNGDGIYNTYGSMGVYNSNIHDNNGGIYNSGSISMCNSNVHDNNGGIYNVYGSMGVYYSDIHGNSGGIFNVGWMTVYESNIHDNNGDGIFNFGGSMDLENSNIHHNNGSGNFNVGWMSVNNCDIHDNNGNGIFNSGGIR